MNDFYARRWSQTLQWQAMQRLHPVLHKVTRHTREPFTYNYFREEFMRTNARRAAPLTYFPTHEHVNLLCPVDSLVDNDAANVSTHAHDARYGSSITQHMADVALFRESLPTVRVATSLQALCTEDVARKEGIMVPEVDHGAQDGDDGNSE
eukprot:PhM_4_TR10309/c0_g1_i1/m.16286